MEDHSYQESLYSEPFQQGLMSELVMWEGKAQIVASKEICLTYWLLFVEVECFSFFLNVWL